MDAIELMTKEHKAVKRAMEDVARSMGVKREVLFKAFRRDLEAHDRLAERVFYPALAAFPKAAAFAEKDREAHEGMEQAMARLAELAYTDEDWQLNFRSMQDHLLKHVADEESHLFPQLRKMLGPDEMGKLTTRMLAAAAKAVAP